MRKILVLSSLALAAFLAIHTPEAMAQARTITGQVTAAETGEPLPGVTVLVQGTQIGTQTAADGRYTLNVPADATTLVFAYFGYAPQNVPIAGGTIDVQMVRQALSLEGLVVTGLGQTVERSRLGTAQQTVTADELNQSRTHNVMSQLQGKVSGVAITSAGNPGGSVNINIRGVNSISGNNQPLFIVDGTPVSNADRGGGLVSGYDLGNAISDLNSDDIESITVLKGPNAAAIYGSQAANGVILVTTKRGRAGGIQTAATVTYDWARPSVLPDFQDMYGQGSGGEFAYVNGAGAGNCDGCDQSYGPKLDGRTTGCVFTPGTTTYDTSEPCRQFTGVGLPWEAHPDNVKDFFDTGHTITTNVAVSGGTDDATGRLSLGMDKTFGYIPNNTFRKMSALLSGRLQLSDRLTTSGSVNYVRNSGFNRPGTGYSGSAIETFFWFGRQVDIDALRNYSQGGAVNNGPANREFNWNYNFHNNPFWLQYENPNNDNRDRLTISGTAEYQFTPTLRAELHSGSDITSLDVEQDFGNQNINFTNPNYSGGFTFLDEYRNNNTTRFNLNLDRDINSHITTSAMAGIAARREYRSFSSQSTDGISVPGIYNVANAAIVPELDQFVSRRAVNSVFGSLGFTWNGWWTVQGTGRNDWSSTLPGGANSYFYPSINTSVVLTDAIPSLQNGILSYAKIRGSVARVGNDATPYQLLTTYTGNPNKLNGQPQFSLENSLANGDLKPEITTSSEGGIELAFFQNRLNLDVTYYDKTTRNQIFNVPISAASGFLAKAVNAGAINNRGWEALVSVTPIESDEGLTWTSTVNWAKNRSEITDLYPGVETIILGDVTDGRSSIFGDIQLQARKGKPYGAIYGAAFKRNEAGQLLVNDNGWPLPADTFSYLGTVQPDWTGGWLNELTYGPVHLNVLFDVKHGGSLYSYTNMVGETSGVLESTLRGREVDWNDPGIVVDGVNETTGEKNTKVVTSEAYFQSLFGISEPYVYDAGYVKLREVRLGLDVPSEWTDRMRLSALNVAITGRNLITWKNVPNIDPEFTYASTNYQGVEYAFPSNPRSIGVSISVRP